MLNAASPPLTLETFRELPEGPPYYQLIEGDLYMSPAPNLYHQRILLSIAVLIENYLERHPVGAVFIAPSDVELDELNAFEPDLYFVSNERRNLLTHQGASGAPDLVVEILSPGTARFDKGVKRQVYARVGVRELWIVDPDKRQVQVFQLQADRDKPAGTYSGRQRFSSPLLPGLRIPVPKVFQR